MTGDADLPRALAHDHTGAALSEQDRAMVEYAVKLTVTPHSVTRSDVERLRRSGFDDTGVLDICQVVSYYNYVNRRADGLGVEIEPEWEGRELTMTHAEFEARTARRHGTSAGRP